MNITTVNKLAEKHDGLTEQSIRWAVFKAEENGLADSGAIFRKGRRIFIVEDRYLDWLSNGSCKQAENAA